MRKPMSADGMLTRREACVVLGALGLGALGLAGCGGASSDPTSRAGFAGDTDVKSYPVHLKLYVDSYIQWDYANTRTSDVPRDEKQTQIDNKIKRYQSQKDRSEVSFEVVYLDTTDILTMAYEGFPDGDGIIAMKQAVLYGCANGVLDGGIGNLYVRNHSYHFADNVSLVRLVGSDANLPPAATLTGENAPDGSINQLQQLPKFNGKIAIADPATTLEARIANAALAKEGFYVEASGTPIKLRQGSNGEMTDALSALVRDPLTPVKLRPNSDGTGDEFYLEGSRSLLGGMFGGSFREDIAEKIVTYPNQDAAIAAVVSGECQLGFALQNSLRYRYPEVESVGVVNSWGRVQYESTSLSGSAEPGVMRDFFEFITRCSD